MKIRVFANIVAILAISGCAEVNETILKASQEEGAVTTQSGMVYRSLRKGEGKYPTNNNIIEVNYRGTFPDGKEFGQGTNIKMRLSNVIPCWNEGIKMMKSGGKAQLVCPPRLAYGTKGAGDDIPPNMTLIFEVELLGFR